MAGNSRTVRKGSEKLMRKASGELQLRPLILLRGKDKFLVERAVEQVKKLINQADLEIHELNAASYVKGQLLVEASASLFSQPRLLVISGLEAMNEVFLTEALAFLESTQLQEGIAAADLFCIFIHEGGQRGKKILTALEKAGAWIEPCTELKSYELEEFIQVEAKRLKVRVERQTLGEIIEAVGNDLRELVGSLKQLASDVGKEITSADVKQYFGYKAEVSGFKVADLAVSGQTGAALVALRQAFHVGSNPVALVAVLGMRIRQVAKYLAYRQGKIELKELGMASWQINKIRNETRYWTPRDLGICLQELARSDYDTKGGSKDPEFAVERLVRVIAAAGSRKILD